MTKPPLDQSAQSSSPAASSSAAASSLPAPDVRLPYSASFPAQPSALGDQSASAAAKKDDDVNKGESQASPELGRRPKLLAEKGLPPSDNHMEATHSSANLTDLKATSRCAAVADRLKLNCLLQLTLRGSVHQASSVPVL